MSFPKFRAAHAVAALCLVAVVSPAPAAPPIDLPEAVRLGLARAPLPAAGAQQVEAAREDGRRAGALPDPMLSVGLQNLPVTGAPAWDGNADDMTMKVIGLRQDIPARARREAERALAARNLEAADADLDQQRQDTARQVAQAWIALWAAQQTGAALVRLREQAVLAAAVAKARVRAGSESALAALTADAQVLELDTRLAANRSELAAAQAGLQRWLGTGEILASDEVPDFTRLPFAPAQVQAALDRLPALAPARAQVETASARIDLARAARHPDWSVQASYGQRSGGRSDMLSLQFEIGLPLFPRQRQDRAIAARQADYQAALDRRDDARREVAAQVQAGFARWQGLQQQLALLTDRLLPLAHDRSATALATYRAGGELQPWLDAARAEREAQLAVVERRAELGRAWAELAYLLPTENRP